MSLNDGFDNVMFDDSKIHIKSQGKFFSAIFYLSFVFFIISTVTVIIFASMVFNNTLKVKSHVGDITSKLNQYSTILTGNCWSCELSTGTLQFLSKNIENDLLNTDITTPNYFDQGVNLNFFETGTGDGGPVNFMGLNMAIDNNNNGLPSASLILGNMSRLTPHSVKGIPKTHRSVMGIGSYNGDVISVNTRCSEISNTIIYILYNFNNLNNLTEYNFCLCDNLAEYCMPFNNVDFSNQTAIIPP